MRSQQEWEKWYAEPNPWGTDGSDKDLVRIDVLFERLKYARFANVLDVGCGEGRLTNALSTVAHKSYGIDIAANALERARTRYPHIDFRQGDLLDVVKRPDIAAIPFDFIAASEVLYYLQTDDERHAALVGLAELGAPSCLYYFSVIVTGSSKYRRYFTHDEFVRLVSEHFTIIDAFPSVADVPVMLSVLCRLLPSQKLSRELIKAWTITRKLDKCRHVGYFAVKRRRAASDVAVQSSARERAA